MATCSADVVVCSKQRGFATSCTESAKDPISVQRDTCCQTRSENNGAKALNRETNNQGKGVNATTSGGQSQISRTTFINGQSRAQRSFEKFGRCLR
jgi:hypothetical protein